MGTIVHFVDVGQGNMVLIEADDGKKFVFDCNITEENENRVLNYIELQIGRFTHLDAFICSHREADHMRGVRKLHARFPIQQIWDSDYPGTTTDSAEYREYMDLRRRLGVRVIKRLTRNDYGQTRMRYMSAADERLASNANAQGIVIKVEHRSSANDKSLSSAMLPADSDAETWRYAVMKDYASADLDSSILMAGHHGALTFFDDPGDTKSYFIAHLAAIRPYATVISVGTNNHGHPDAKAIEFYSNHAVGTRNGDKIFRTDTYGTVKFTMNDDGTSSIG